MQRETKLSIIENRKQKTDVKKTVVNSCLKYIFNLKLIWIIVAFLGFATVSLLYVGGIWEENKDNIMIGTLMVSSEVSSYLYVLSDFLIWIWYTNYSLSILWKVDHRKFLRAISKWVLLRLLFSKFPFIYQIKSYYILIYKSFYTLNFENSHGIHSIDLISMLEFDW